MTIKYFCKCFKFIHVSASNSNYSCKLCKWNSKDKVKIDAKWSISGRSNEEARELTNKTKKNEKYGHKREAIFK